MGKLARLIEYHLADSSKKAELMSSGHFRNQIGEQTIVKLQENTDSGASLIQEEVYKQVVEGAQKAVCFRDIIPIIKTGKGELRIPKVAGADYAEDVAEGAAIPVKTGTYSHVSISIKKIGERPLITREMIDDALFDVVELELKRTGHALENKFNRDCIYELITGSTGTAIDPTTDSFTVSYLAKAIKNVKTNNFNPDTAIFHPFAEAQLFSDSNLVYVSYAGTEMTLREGKIPKLLGLQIKTLSVTTGDSTYYWDDTDDTNHYMAAVLDSAKAIFAGIREDITINNYNDPIYDLVGIAATMRYGVKTVNGAASVLINTNTVA